MWRQRAGRQSGMDGQVINAKPTFPHWCVKVLLIWFRGKGEKRLALDLAPQGVFLRVSGVLLAARWPLPFQWKVLERSSRKWRHSAGPGDWPGKTLRPQYGVKWSHASCQRPGFDTRKRTFFTSGRHNGWNESWVNNTQGFKEGHKNAHLFCRSWCFDQTKNDYLLIIVEKLQVLAQTFRSSFFYQLGELFILGRILNP